MLVDAVQVLKSLHSAVRLAVLSMLLQLDWPLLPTVAAGVSQNATRTPRTMTGTGEAAINRQYNGGLSLAAYELDFFGKVRNGAEAGLQTYLGTEEARRTQQISLVAEVANAYLTLIADQQRLKLAAFVVAVVLE